jgi:ABC-type amino acid transport substrate-binding protein
MNRGFKTLLAALALSAILAACGYPAGNGAADGGATEAKRRASEPVNTMDPRYLPTLADEFRRIHENGFLTVGMYSEDRFPFFFVDGRGELAGSDVEMAYDIARQLGVAEVRFDRSARSFEELVDLVAAGRYDLAVSKISITLNRAQRVLFSEPYLSLRQALLVNRIQMAALKNRQMSDPVEILRTSRVKIGAMAGTSYMEFAREIFHTAEIVPYDARERMLEDVRRGDIAAALYDEFEFQRYINEFPDVLLDLQFVVLEGRKDNLAVAIPPEHFHMQAWLKEYLAYQQPLDIPQLLERYGNSPGEAGRGTE